MTNVFTPHIIGLLSMFLYCGPCPPFPNTNFLASLTHFLISHVSGSISRSLLCNIIFQQLSIDTSSYFLVVKHQIVSYMPMASNTFYKSISLFLCRPTIQLQISTCNSLSNISMQLSLSLFLNISQVCSLLASTANIQLYCPFLSPGLQHCISNSFPHSLLCPPRPTSKLQIE